MVSITIDLETLVPYIVVTWIHWVWLQSEVWSDPKHEIALFETSCLMGDSVLEFSCLDVGEAKHHETIYITAEMNGEKRYQWRSKP